MTAFLRGMSLETPFPVAFLASITESVDQAIFAFDVAAKRFIYLNPAFEKVWRKKRKSVMENPSSLCKMIHPEDKPHVLAVYQELLEGVIIKEIEFRLKLRNDTERWVCLKPVLLEEPGLVAGFVHDITAQKQYNDYLKKFSD